MATKLISGDGFFRPGSSGRLGAMEVEDLGLDLEADQEAVPLSQEAAGATDSVPQPSAEARIKRHRKSSSNASRV